ncbi:hypothetical protein FRB93_011715 [Tulasnella sp. JGI-2019a]|nr:hypothetical protein FRB93_011715 [Tulasnella sp. JGI-2019a]
MPFPRPEGSPLPANWTSVTPTELTESGPIKASLSESIVEGMPMGDVSTSSEVLSTRIPSLSVGTRSMKYKREVPESSLLQVTTIDAPSAKRRKASPSANDKEIDDDIAWSLDGVRIQTASYVKSVWSATREWRR